MKFSYSQSSQKDKIGYSAFDTRGLILTEILIASSLAVAIVAISIIIFLNNIRPYQRGSRQAGVEQNAQIQSERLSRELREAKKIT